MYKRQLLCLTLITSRISKRSPWRSLPGLTKTVVTEFDLGDFFSVPRSMNLVWLLGISDMFSAITFRPKDLIVCSAAMAAQFFSLLLAIISTAAPVLFEVHSLELVNLSFINFEHCLKAWSLEYI